MATDRAWASTTADGTPCVVIGPPDESIRHSLIPPDVARERARDLRSWLPRQTMGHGQHAEFLRFADELETAADEAQS